jgi:curved DNA-binding protein CbpA
MTRLHTHYDNLKVARDATPEVIRAAYRSLSRKYHPDRNYGKPAATRIMALINSSYSVLSDTQSRADHDRWIAEQESGTESVHIAAPPVLLRRSARPTPAGHLARASRHVAEHWQWYLIFVLVAISVDGITFQT